VALFTGKSPYIQWDFTAEDNIFNLRIPRKEIQHNYAISE